MSWRILSLNIEGDKHFDTVIPYLQEVKPDIICLQEVFAADVERFVAATGYQATYAPLVSYNQPNRYDISPRGKWGVLTLTPVAPINSAKVYYHGQADRIPEFVDGQPNSANRAFVWVEVELPGHPSLQVVNTHFTWSPNGEANDEQRLDLAEMLSQLENYDEFILCGDFNAPRGKEIFAQLASRYTDNLPPEVTTTIDGQFHYAGQLEIVVDGFFTTPRYQVESLQVRAGLSDHQGLLAQVSKTE